MSARTAGIDSATDMILEEKLEYPEKIRNEEIMEKFRLHFAIPIRQRDKEIKKQ
jgi:hypothetical protein